MPVSKHRRKGKTRPRGRINSRPPLWPPMTEAERVAYEAEKAIGAQNDALIKVRLQEKFGGAEWGDWTDAQFDVASEELSAEGKLLKYAEEVIPSESAPS